MSLPKEMFESEAVYLEKDFCSESQVKEFIESVSNGETPDKGTLKGLAFALEQILLGKDANIALGVSKRAAHRPKTSKNNREEKEEFYNVLSVYRGEKTYEELGLSRSTYQRLKKKHERYLESTERFLSTAKRVAVARDYIVKELGLKANETHALDLLTCAGITHLEEMVKNSSVSEMKKIKDEILKLSQ